MGEGTIETLVKPGHERGTVVAQLRTTLPAHMEGGYRILIVIAGKNKK